MLWRTSTVTGLVVLVVASAGCGQAGREQPSSAQAPPTCTLIGCANGVYVQVDEPGERPLEACVGATCSVPGGPLLWVVVPVDGEVAVVVRVAGGGDEVDRIIATPTTRRPNGPTCGPECKTVRLRLTVDDQLVPA